MKVVFRTDASLDIGTGHVMRCLTLANALRERGAKCHFVCREHAGHLGYKITEQGFGLSLLKTGGTQEDALRGNDDAPVPHADWLGCGWQVDAEQTSSVLFDQKTDWLVVDHYGLDRRWEQVQRTKTGRIMVIDDLADRSHDCDVLLDQNLGRKKNDYDGLVAECTQLLVGPQYALLRPEFAAIREYSLRRRAIPVLKKILVSLGGFDPENVTKCVLNALKEAPLPEDCTIDVVLGEQAPSRESVRKQIATSCLPATLLVGVSDMASLMADADLAIGAAGTSSWERCCLGLPCIALVIADNQQMSAKALQQSGAVEIAALGENIDLNILGNLEKLSNESVLRTMSHAASTLTDGLGALRVCNAMESSFHTMYRIRSARKNDEQFLLELANEKLTRRNSFSTGQISKSTHHEWFLKRIGTPDSCRIFIFETADSIPVGQVRFEANARFGWEIDYALAPVVRGKGLSKYMLSMAMGRVQNELGSGEVEGKVKKCNIASCLIFESLGFKKRCDEGADVITYTRHLGEAL